MVGGHPAHPHGINSEGLRRREFSAEAITQIKRAYKLLYKEKRKLTEAVAALRKLADEWPEIGLMCRFLEQSERSIVR